MYFEYFKNFTRNNFTKGTSPHLTNCSNHFSNPAAVNAKHAWES